MICYVNTKYFKLLCDGSLLPLAPRPSFTQLDSTDHGVRFRLRDLDIIPSIALLTHNIREGRIKDDME